MMEILYLECFFKVILFLAFNLDFMQSDDGCTSLKGFVNKTNDLSQQNATIECHSSDSCSGIDCLIYLHGSLQYKADYGLSFESGCYNGSRFYFYWKCDSYNTSQSYPLVGSNIQYIQLSDKSPSHGNLIGDNISISTSSFETEGYRFVLTLKVLLNLREGSSITLFPLYNLTTRPMCFSDNNDNNFLSTASNSLNQTPNRTDTGRKCNIGHFGSCGDNEVCDASNRCLCLTNHQLNSVGLCVPSTNSSPNNSTSASTFWAIFGGSVVGLIIIGVLVFIVQKYIPRRRRYDTFDLLAQDSLPDPPMLEA